MADPAPSPSKVEGWLNQHVSGIQPQVSDVLEMKRRGKLMDNWRQCNFTFSIETSTLSWTEEREGEQCACEICVSKYSFKSVSGLMKRRNRIDVWGQHVKSKQEIIVSLAALSDEVFGKWQIAFQDSEGAAHDVDGSNDSIFDSVTSIDSRQSSKGSVSSSRKPFGSPSRMKELEEQQQSSDSDGEAGAAKVGLHSFELIRVLGKGSFGKVMLVRHIEMKRLFAMKTLHKKELRKKRQLLHTATERAILEQLKHPFLTKLEFAFQSSGKLYLIMNFCSGGELFFWLARAEGRRFSVARVRLYAAEILLALGHLHSHDAIYRDLKPQNVLIQGDGHLALADFGLAKFAVSGAGAEVSESVSQ
jgi:tRNA A-37 threonylcarbamoyl transferase component Bud32